jgi:predicted AAA+ superfamily ATPase
MDSGGAAMYAQEIDRILNDFWELGFCEYVPRQGSLICVKRMVSTVIGARRVGKSTRVQQYASQLLETGELHSIRQVVLIDFDNPILAEMPCSALHLIEETVYKNNPDFDLGTRLVFIFDEIHKIPGWENYCVQLSRNGRRTVIVTGSSSKLLRDDIAAKLRGKAVSTQLFGLSFSELLKG